MAPVGLNIALTKPAYIGQVKVMERQPTQQGVQVFQAGYVFDPNQQTHLNDLGVIATSERVLGGAARTLAMLNISSNPEELLRTVKVEPVRDSQVLNIEVRSGDRDQAENAADVVASEFQRAYREIMGEPNEKSREFIESQIPVANKELTRIREELRRFKEENGIVELQQQSQLALRRSEDYHVKLADAEVDDGQNTAYLNAVRDQFEMVRRMPKFREVSSSVQRNPFYEQLFLELQRAEVERAALAETKDSEHPDLMEAEKRVAEIKAKLYTVAGTARPKMTEMSPAGSTKQLEPLIDTMRESYLRAKISQIASSARRQALEQVVARTDPELKTLPEKEMKLAKLLVDEQAAERTYTLLLQKFDEAKIKEQESKTSGAIKIIEAAHVFPVKQKNILKVGLALLLSPLLSAAVVFLLYYLDNSIKTPAEAEELLGLPVFTVVPRTRQHSFVRHKDPAALMEIYQILSSSLWSNLDITEGACIMMAGAEPNTGRSVSASNLAVTLARDGARVILVDADLRQPAQHAIFGVDNKYGLTNVLGGGALIEDVLRPTKFDGLLLMTSGPVPDNPVRLLRSPEMKTFVEQVSAVADFVIFDSPAGIAFADAGILASSIRNVILVHAAGRVSRGAEAEFQSRLDQAGANMIGAVLNMVHPDDCHGYFHYRRAYQDTLSLNRRQLVPAGGPKAIAGGDS